MGQMECEYCRPAPKHLAVIEAADPRIFLTVSGSYLQIFDEEYPGFVDNIKIHNCPMCGRALGERIDRPQGWPEGGAG